MALLDRRSSAVGRRVYALLEEAGMSDWSRDLTAHLVNLLAVFDEQAAHGCARGFDQELVRLIRLRWYGFWSPLALEQALTEDREAEEKIK
jgi:hypothetical protein